MTAKGRAEADSAQKDGTRRLKLSGKSRVIDLTDGKAAEPTKIYAVNGITNGTWGAMIDDPRAYTVEGGIGLPASPDLIGVFSSPGLALEAGIHTMMKELKEGLDEGDLDGFRQLEAAKWVDEDDNPYDEDCPLEQDYYTEDSFHDKDSHLIGKPRGRASYLVFLVDPDEPEDEYKDDVWACVVVQEITLDEQEVDR